jgi:hypothetical protein
VPKNRHFCNAPPLPDTVQYYELQIPGVFCQWQVFPKSGDTSSPEITVVQLLIPPVQEYISSHHRNKQQVQYLLNDWIIFDRFYNCRDIIFISFKINDTIFALMSTTNIPHGHFTGIVPSTTLF